MTENPSSYYKTKLLKQQTTMFDAGCSMVANVFTGKTKTGPNPCYVLESDFAVCRVHRGTHAGAQSWLLELLFGMRRGY